MEIGQPVYILHRALGPDQYLLRSRDEAVAQAGRFARRLQVRVWLNDEGHHTVLQNFWKTQSGSGTHEEGKRTMPASAGSSRTS